MPLSSFHGRSWVWPTSTPFSAAAPVSSSRADRPWPLPSPPAFCRPLTFSSRVNAAAPAGFCPSASWTPPAWSSSPPVASYSFPRAAVSSSSSSQAGATPSSFSPGRSSIVLVPILPASVSATHLALSSPTTKLASSTMSLSAFSVISVVVVPFSTSFVCGFTIASSSAGLFARFIFANLCK